MRDVLIGQTDYSVLVKIVGTDGAPATGLAHTDIDIAYTRVETDNDVTTSDVAPADLASLTAAHSDWGWEEISASDHPGLYRLDIADAVFASGAWEAVVTITDASGTDFYAVDVGFRLVAVDPQSGDLTAAMKASVNAEVDTALSDYGALKPTVAGRTLDVSAGGEAGIDWANIGGATTTVNLSGTTIDTDQVVASVTNPVVATDVLGNGLASATVLNQVATNVGSILVDTEELQQDWANGGRLDVILDARASQASVDALNDLSSSDVQTAAAAALNAYDPPTKAELDAGLDALPTAAENATAVLTTQMTEAYRATGAAPTLAQAQFELIAHMGNSSITGTTKTLKKLDQSTTAKDYSFDSAITPTSISENS